MGTEATESKGEREGEAGKVESRAGRAGFKEEEGEGGYAREGGMMG